MIYHSGSISTDFTKMNVGCIAALQDCGLLKFFQTPSMVSHERLLEHILQMWNPEQQHFEVGAHILIVEVEDIYYLDWNLETGCPHLVDRFPRRGYYHTRFDRPSLYPRDEDIGEENPHKGSDGWAPTDYLIYYAESGQDSGFAPGF